MELYFPPRALLQLWRSKVWYYYEAAQQFNRVQLQLSHKLWGLHPMEEHPVVLTLLSNKKNPQTLQAYFFVSITTSPAVKLSPVALNVIFPALAFGRIMIKHFPLNVLCSGF